MGRIYWFGMADLPGRLTLKLALLVSMCLGSSPVGAADDEFRIPVPPRLQWEANHGYCGEVAMISAGLYYGQYLSQYDARICAIGRTPQNRGELLLGVNARRAATRMALSFEEWNTRNEPTPDPGAFLDWVRGHLQQGHPVIIGVFNNEYLLYGIKNPNAGDPDYDHIVPVIGVKSDTSAKTASGSDTIIFSDNGLYGNAQNRPYIFEYRFDQFSGDRMQANASGRPVYMLPDDGPNYGIAVLGVADTDGETLPVRITTDRNFENPAIAEGSNLRPPPMPLTLKITVSNLTPNVDYRLYRYDRLAAVPTSRFNAHASRAVEVIPLRSSGDTFSLTRSIQSDDQVAFRCVRASAP